MSPRRGLNRWARKRGWEKRCFPRSNKPSFALCCCRNGGNARSNGQNSSGRAEARKLVAVTSNGGRPSLK